MEEITPNSIGLEFDRGTLLLEMDNPALLYDVIDKRKIIPDSRVNRWRCDAFYYRDILEMLLSTGYELDDRVADWKRLYWNRIELHTLRREQKKAIKPGRRTKEASWLCLQGLGRRKWLFL